MKKVKIVATIGPATANENMIKKLMTAGVDVFRLNFSHGDHTTHRKNVEMIRKVSEETGREVAILQDLSGPKIRIGDVKEPFYLHYEDKIWIVKDEVLGDKEKISINHPEILDKLREGDRIYISDGMIRLRVIEKTDKGVLCEVIVGGLLSSRKGVNFPSVKLDIPSLTEKDKEDIKFGIETGIDIVALSFVKSAEDVVETKNFIKENGGDSPVFAKIEKHEAVEDINRIVEVSDGIMVARGDLGVEIDMEKVPVIQKMVISKCNKSGKPVITATQMLTSMLTSPRPTRAEVSDIANAVLDGTDAVMLSDETAVGKYPVEAVEVMKKTIIETEKIYPFYKEMPVDGDITAAVASAGSSLAKDLEAKAIVSFTRSGRTAINVAKFRPQCEILGITHDIKTFRRLNIVWGVKPYMIIQENLNTDEMLEKFVNEAYKKDFSIKDITVALLGFVGGISGSTSIVRVLREEEIKQFLRKILC
ncbi:pyruvate kinase [Persephonella hydrogeniphila]|uniref:Pyruvate kinase n=1 Tax=Persephonella hydrogeniphila TaxID=198703 RepID=A0A285NJT3_9AQUI|nr:pyruvate kinase [Persephonella hydrogeniphila]SNZ09217.1 pyruvate kinase [Persephonella hydrogeniphila]